MPNKSGQTSSSSPSHSAQVSSDSNSRMSDVAIRKKKNADAQAAFRARRANYIATLEETVTSLESVVLQLQDSCREARSDATELRQANTRLRHEFREREKFWKALWHTRKSGESPGSNDLPPLPATYSPSHSHQNLSTAHLNSSHANQYGDENMGYRASNDSSAPLCSPYNASASSQTYPSQSPSLSYASANDQIPSNGSSHQLNSHRAVNKYGYTYPMHNGSHRDGQWHSSSNGDSGAAAVNGSSHSPAYGTSPTLTSPTLTSSEMSYVHHRYPMEDQKVPLNSLDTAPYVFPNSRSLSPTASTPPSSSSSTSLTSPFQFNFPEGSVSQERPEYDYRRQSSNHGADVSLHAGGPDISLAGPGSDAVRYRIDARRTDSGGERSIIPALAPFSGSDGSQNDRGSSEGEAGPYILHQRRPRRDTVGSSRSPSPSTPPISGTLAVIKAQAFGALRRTRTRPRKSGEGASRVAMEALESRAFGMGLGVGTNTKRQRLEDDDSDMQNELVPLR